MYRVVVLGGTPLSNSIQISRLPLCFPYSRSWRGGQIRVDRSLHPRQVCFRLQPYHRRSVPLPASPSQKLNLTSQSHTIEQYSCDMQAGGETCVVRPVYSLPLSSSSPFPQTSSSTSWTLRVQNNSLPSTKSTSRYLWFPHQRTTQLIRSRKRAGSSSSSGNFKSPLFFPILPLQLVLSNFSSLVLPKRQLSRMSTTSGSRSN